MFLLSTLFFQQDLLAKAKTRSWKVLCCSQISGFHRVVAKACSCQQRRLKDTTITPLLDITKQE